MIRTYEVHDSDSEDDDRMVEFDPQVVENLNWWQKCFVPKYPDSLRCNTEDDIRESDNPIPSEQKGERVVENVRGRFHSEDVTISTNVTTPPGTPDIKRSFSASSSSQNVLNNSNGIMISQHSSNFNDVETPLIRNAIPAIDEEDPEEAEKANQERGEQQQILGTQLSTAL